MSCRLLMSMQEEIKRDVVFSCCYHVRAKTTQERDAKSATRCCCGLKRNAGRSPDTVTESMN